MDVTLEKTMMEKFGLPAGAAAGVLELVREDCRKEIREELEQELRQEMEQRLEQKLGEVIRELTEVEERYRQVLELSSSAIVIHRDGKLVFANSSAARMWGAKSPADMISGDVFDFIHPDSLEKVWDRIGKMITLGVSVEPIDEDFQARDGTIFNMEVAAAPITYMGEPAIVVVAENVTLRKEMVALFQTMSDHAPNAIAIIQDQRICYINRMFVEISGYSEDELIGKTSLSIILGADRPKVRRYSAKMLAGERTIPYEYRGVKKNGEIIWLMESMARIQYRGKPAILANLIDITERKQMEEQVKNAVLYDRMTGHYNRVYFEEEMRRLAKARPLPVSVVVCDVDGLKLVNDTMGYDAGDRLIKVAGDLVSACTGGRHMVARMGAGEFHILLSETSAAAVAGFCEQLAGRIEKHNVDNPGLPLSMSIGMATWGEAGSEQPDLSQVLKVAYSHMFREKMLHRWSARSTIVEALMKTLAARDIITQEHADRMLDLVLELARATGLPNHRLADLSLLVRFHDIGKVGVPDSILLKPGPLNPEEIAVMRRHTEIGCQIALAAPELVPVADLIGKHHEWWDGSGYHLGLSGEEIPVECRILAVVDAFDAMTSDRPYRQAMTQTQAVEELRRCAGTQFDPRLVEEMVRIIDARGGEKEGNGKR
ncbi:MAG: PAS domain S-box protein [Peptococcaceae bacterium]|jgi:PAS domain S-box-containing protein/diguanylate cyclase (GGDEF)-like protein|nr:PAS domain S-box protein [Peptococcaceae bacterium]